MTTTLTRESLFASPRAQHQAHGVAVGLDAADAAHEPIAIAGVPLDDEIRSLLHRIVAIIGEGGTVTVGSLPEVVTTTTAADLLGVSRTTLMKLVRAGDIPSTQVGSHTKLRRDDVLAFRREGLQQQRDALDRLLALEDELDLR